MSPLWFEETYIRYEGYKNVLASLFSYYYDVESGFYYLKSRYYDPEICRFINADGLASTGQGFIGCNMFAYCLNNPVNGLDPNGARMDYFIVSEAAVGPGTTAIEKARQMGERAKVDTGWISFAFESEYEEFCQIANALGMISAAEIISQTACAKYERELGHPFLLSDACVAFEYYEHVLAYQWAVGDRVIPNVLVIGWTVISWNPDKEKVKLATKDIDIRESDVTPSNYQAIAFSYYSGIRDCYYGTESDPWRYLR